MCDENFSINGNTFPLEGSSSEFIISFKLFLPSSVFFQLSWISTKATENNPLSVTASSILQNTTWQIYFSWIPISVNNNTDILGVIETEQTIYQVCIKDYPQWGLLSGPRLWYKTVRWWHWVQPLFPPLQTYQLCVCVCVCGIFNFPCWNRECVYEREHHLFCSGLTVAASKDSNQVSTDTTVKLSASSALKSSEFHKYGKQQLCVDSTSEATFHLMHLCFS